MPVGLVVRLLAKPDRAEEVRALLEQSLPLAQEEDGTVIWLAVRTGETEFWIVDVHPSDGDRQAHLEGPIAAAIMAKADELLSEPPRITPSVVIATKP